MGWGPEEMGSYIYWGGKYDMVKEFEENQTSEKDFVDTINKKYGQGNLDITTGVFTPKK